MDVTRSSISQIKSFVNEILEGYPRTLGWPPNVYYDPELIEDKRNI